MHRPSDMSMIGTIPGPAAGSCFAPGHPWASRAFASSNDSVSVKAG